MVGSASQYSAFGVFSIQGPGDYHSIHMQLMQDKFLIPFIEKENLNKNLLCNKKENKNILQVHKNVILYWISNNMVK